MATHQSIAENASTTLLHLTDELTDRIRWANGVTVGLLDQDLEEHQLDALKGPPRIGPVQGRHGPLRPVQQLLPADAEGHAVGCRQVHKAVQAIAVVAIDVAGNVIAFGGRVGEYALAVKAAPVTNFPIGIESKA